DLADGRGCALQAGQRSQEASILLVRPAHVAGAAPAALAEAVEAAVVADAEVRVGLDVVARELTEPGPPIEEPRVPSDHRSDRIATLGRGSGERGREPVERVLGFGREHGLRRARRRQVHIAHAGNLSSSELDAVEPAATVDRRYEANSS